MTLTTDIRPDHSSVPAHETARFDADPFDLDITIFESGEGLDEIIRMTDDGCGSTCDSACNSCST